jgi:uncharacterized protein YdhG (YjbR/CyaY superfamily)
MHDDDESIEDFIDKIEPERKCTAREVVEFMRSRLGEVEERVQDGMAIFSRNGIDITGVSVTNKHVKLFVPDSQVAEEYSARLGNVETDEAGVRFEQLTDIKRTELRKMVDRLGSENATQANGIRKDD